MSISISYKNKKKYYIIRRIGTYIVMIYTMECYTKVKELVDFKICINMDESQNYNV